MDQEELAAKKAMIRFLSRKAHFSDELKKKLENQGYSAKVIEKLLTEAKLKGYVNDEDLTKRFVHRMQQKGYGARLIYQKLRTKTKKDLCLKHCIETNAIDTIKNLLKGRYASKLKGKDKKERNKVIASLLRKGFELEDIFASLKDHE